MDELVDATLRMKASRPRESESCGTPRHNWRAASWCKKPTNFAPSSSRFATVSSGNGIGETSCSKYESFDVSTQGDYCDESESSSSFPPVMSKRPFLDSQGRNMKLLCPPMQSLALRKYPDKGPLSMVNTTRKEVGREVDSNCIGNACCEETEPGNIGDNEVVEEESEDRLAQCDKECSEILPYLYLGSKTVAQNLAMLHRCRITHILNCVGYACEEAFPNNFFYKTLWLQDSPSEDLTCILYDVFDYFEEVREKTGSRVFVHCCQGVSRSVALVIAYLMWKEHCLFDDAYAFVKAARCIASPNIGFVVQLTQWQTKIHASPSNKIFRMYRLASQSPYAPGHFVPKIVAEPNIQALDSVGVFIIQIANRLYVWRGRRSVLEMVAAANRSAFQLVRYEHAQGPIVACNEGYESAKLLEAFGTADGEEREED